MRKIVLCFFITILLFSSLEAQVRSYSQHTKSVLYLLATNADKLAVEEENVTLDAFNSSVIGFWCGAQIALEEMEADGANLKVIVRDINASDSLKLYRVLNEPEVSNVDLIIAAVPRNIFPIVAQFAYTNKIRVINPFSTDSELTQNNPYVYKLMPNKVAKPVVATSYFPGANIILWADKWHKDADTYEKYLTDKNIRFHKVPSDQPVSNYLSSSRENLIIACFTQQQNYTDACNYTNGKNVTWIVPEQLILNDDFDSRIFKDSPLYFFSNCFFNPTSEEYKLFQYNYFKRFNALPTLESFATQGYDITRYFVGDLCNTSAAFERPLSYGFRFIQRENGGYENFGIRFVQFTNLAYKIIQPQ